MSTQTGREVAHRVFATEYNAAAHEVSDSDDERAPNYVIMPTGARVNRLFVVGVLTSVESVSEETLRARIADPTGTFVIYAGQYQPDERATLERIDPPAFVAVTGKANTFTPEGSDEVLTSIRPEAVNEVDGDTRDRWVLSTAEHTRNRIARMAGVLQAQAAGQTNEPDHEAAHSLGIEQALEAYGTTAGYLAALEECVTEAVAVIAGQQSEATPVDIAPGDPGPGGLDSLTESEQTVTTPADTAADTATADDGAQTAAPPENDDGDSETTADTTTSLDGDGPADFEPDVDEPLYEFDDDERAEIESEHGLEFATGNEVAPPDEEGHEESETSPETTQPAPEETTEPSDENGDDTDETATTADDDEADVDMVGAVLEALEAHNDGNGVKRTVVVEAVVEQTGASETAVKEAIEEALLSGRCYEPNEDRLKPI